MINVAVEGDSDREMARSLVLATGHEVGIVRVAGGKSRLDPLISKYNVAARFSPWVVFRDSDSKCPVNLSRELLAGVPVLSADFRLRIAHSMSEAWLMADPETFADYFGIRRALLPRDSERIENAKQAVLNLSRGSRYRSIRNDVTASDGDVGPLYVARINEYAAASWRPKVAQDQSSSLRRAIDRVAELPN